MSGGLEAASCQLAGPVTDDFERDLLPFRKGTKARALDGADVDKHILASAAGLNEAETLLMIEPFNCASLHRMLLNECVTM